MPSNSNRRPNGVGEGPTSAFESASSTISDAIASTTAYFSPFVHSSPSIGGGLLQPMPEQNRLLAEVAPHIMRPRILSAAVAAGNTVTSNVSNSALIGFLPLTRTGIGGYSINQPARSLVRLGNTIRQGPVTSTDLKALESSYQILSSVNAANIDEEIQEPKGVAKEVSLLRGFQASLPSSLEGRARRRKQRGRDELHLGLKEMSENARGLLVNGSGSFDSAMDDDGGLQQKQRDKRKARRSLANKAKEIPLTIDELQGQKDEITLEKENLSIRRMLINSEIQEVEARIASLELVKHNLQKSLLGLREEELELSDEYDGVSELLAVTKHRRAMPGGSSREADRTASATHSNSRRRKGPLFLPSEHDELPSGVAFMTLSNHTAPITAIDFSEPYGTLVSSALDDTLCVWDLSSAAEVGRLRGHIGTVKCLQVEDELCITGGADSSIKLWDLHRVEDFETRLNLKQSGELTSSIRESDGEEEKDKEHDPCLRSLEGHSKAVTSLYFDDTCLVTGASDKTLRQWDLNTGQCVLTMDILWAISNPTSSQSLMSDHDGEDSVRSSPIRARHSIATMSPSNSATSVLLAEKNYAGAFSHPTPAFADGSWEMYQDFVGGVQFWGYALASGSGDAAVRMWDSE